MCEIFIPNNRNINKVNMSKLDNEHRLLQFNILICNNDINLFLVNVLNFLRNEESTKPKIDKHSQCEQ